MNNKEQLEKHYKSLGYNYLGYANMSEKAYNAYQQSKRAQWHKVGRGLYLVALHDQKSFIMVDSGD